MLIIPSIELKDKVCVNTLQGSISVVSREPEQLAKLYWISGSKYIQLVDLNAKEGDKKDNIEVLSKIIDSCDFKIYYHCRPTSIGYIEKLIKMGVEKVVMDILPSDNTQLLTEAFEKFGSKLILASYIKNHRLYAKYAKKSSAADILHEITNLSKKGYKDFLFIDLDRKSLMQGVCLSCIQDIVGKINLKISLFGGICSVKDIEEIHKVTNGKIANCMVQKALYDGKLELREIIEKMRALS